MVDMLILGRGFIGERLHEQLKCEISDKKICSFSDIQEEIEKYNPKVLINCIGSTGQKNVDDCENNIDNALFANSFVPIILQEVACRKKMKLVHISSGCIYNFDYETDREIVEDKKPDYSDLFYSRSKAYSERALDVFSEKFNTLIARIRIPLDNKKHPKNLLTKLANYKKIIDVPNSVTYIPDFISALKYLIQIDARGIYNIVNKGGLRYPDLLNEYKKYVSDFDFEIIDLKTFKLNRTNLILSTKKLEKTGFKVREINEVLEECVKEYLK